MPSKNLMMQADDLTGWDSFWGAIWPSYELRRLARKIARHGVTEISKKGPSTLVGFQRRGIRYLVIGKTGDFVTEAQARALFGNEALYGL